MTGNSAPEIENYFKMTQTLAPEHSSLVGKFDLAADLSPAWTWNTKNMMLMVIVEMQDGQTDNQLMLWDKILTKSMSKLDIKNIIAKYPTGISGKKKNLEIDVHIKLDIIPFVGPIHTKSFYNITKKIIPSIDELEFIDLKNSSKNRRL
ncbi:uncharacterized protein LOC126316719 [Schistocerca gregaria]|uniref:uncharacterized protein LOC126316719 n=1 Tax=Schistocerca gregaria TaxID=7010 RepID=UPI00211EC7A7|nr:uncharacterized protein LOC126316719 [Schistocerca gregaria]